MKRTPEFVLGLIGSILALFFSAFICLGAAFMPATEPLAKPLFIANIVGCGFSIIAIVMTCFVNSKPKMSGVLLIILGVAIMFTDFFQVIPLVLLLISGIMCLARNV